MGRGGKGVWGRGGGKAGVRGGCNMFKTRKHPFLEMLFFYYALKKDLSNKHPWHSTPQIILEKALLSSQPFKPEIWASLSAQHQPTSLLGCLKSSPHYTYLVLQGWHQAQCSSGTLSCQDSCRLCLHPFLGSHCSQSKRPDGSQIPEQRS